MSDFVTISNNLTQLILLCENAVQEVRKQQYWKLSYTMKNLSTNLSNYISQVETLFDGSVISDLISTISEIVDCQVSLNYVFLGDLIELKLLPTLYDMQASVLSAADITNRDYFEENLALLNNNNCSGSLKLMMALSAWKEEYKHNPTPFLENYVVEPTNLGAYLTINKKFQKKFYYLHSNKNPVTEAKLFADAYCENGIFHYVLIGFGLGHIVSALLLKDKRYSVTVLESDINILGAAFQHMNLSSILNDNNLTIAYSPNLIDLGDYVHKKCTKLLIHYPSLFTMEEGHTKDLLKDYFIHLSSVQEQKELLDTNFYYNHKNPDKPVDVLKDTFNGQCVIYLGGGPSTETKLPYVKNYLSIHPDTITVCAGKVYRMLLTAGFIPDYVMITDAKPGLIWQLQNIPECKASLLYLATASNNGVNAFQGKKYIMYQQDYPESEKMADKRSCMLFQTGGSVSTAAVDMILRLGCKKLITLGMDYSYPDLKSHAFGISGNVPVNASYQYGKDIHGTDVATTPVFLSYLKWTEKRIKEHLRLHPNTEIINLTDGIPILGMENREQI